MNSRQLSSSTHPARAVTRFGSYFVGLRSGFSYAVVRARMVTGWPWMRVFLGLGLASVTLLLGRSLQRIVGKIFRLRDEQRCGKLHVIAGKDDAKFEIIAVPGLGAHPDHTWEARKTDETTAAESQPVQEPEKIHLLKDLLSNEFSEARILNFVHESNWLLDAPVKTTQEIGRSLIREIKNRRSSRRLPIIFIGHSLGGIIIKQALCHPDSPEIIDDTSGIIFLGTPHQGSSISMAGTALAWITAFLGSDTTLVQSLRSHSAELSDLSRSFENCKAPGQDGVRNFRVRSFYETKPNYLFGLSLGLVVSRDSAALHADDSFPMDTNHTGLNKCGGREDELFKALAGQIRELKAKSPLEQADEWIREKHYTPQRLSIERLSGDLLQMEQCYINLAIVKNVSQDTSHSETKGTTLSSPFSLLGRQKVEVPDKTKQIDLKDIFEERRGDNGQLMKPRRILIRGRAGVGKTTLCKKIVHGFINGEFSNWNELFDRVLWVPLRNLKLTARRALPTYAMEDLICHEFFGSVRKPDLARALSKALETSISNTLFLLDGLDEVSQDLKTQDLTTQDLESQDSMPVFLKTLLQQPNIIITSRPSARAPLKLHLELETIGFGPDQVDEYIKQSFTIENETDVAKVESIRRFLQEHWLIHSLVRIPIQLDALCYTWDDVPLDDTLNTMTRIYTEIELKLWRKDILRLEKRHDGTKLTEENLANMDRTEVERFVTDEVAFMEGLAFTGLHNDAINFTSQHLNQISHHFSRNLLPSKTAPLLSFLRSSDISLKYYVQNYHFIHLTFQEYFAARYFVRQWCSKGKLRFLAIDSKDIKTNESPPEEFLQRQKYTARYDIFWRFVAGLLDEISEAGDFMDAIEQEPLDLLGVTHQRLVMHCLSEIKQQNLPKMDDLETRLAKWLVFESRFYGGNAELASEVEFPETALMEALDEASVDGSSEVQRNILESLKSRASIPPGIVKVVAARLDDDNERVREAAIKALCGQAPVPDDVLLAVVEILENITNPYMQMSAAFALGRRMALSKEVLAAVAVRLNNEDCRVRHAAVTALGKRATLPDHVFEAAVSLINDEDADVRRAAVQVSGSRAIVPSTVCTAIVARLSDEDKYVRREAMKALGKRESMPDEALTAIAAQLNDEEELVRYEAVNALGKQAILPDNVLMSMVARLSDDRFDVKNCAARTLSQCTTLPGRVLTAIVALLDDKFCALAAADALDGCILLHNSVLEAVVARLDSQHCRTRWAAVNVLGRLARTLSDAGATAMAAWFDDEDKCLRRAAIEALGRRLTLSNIVLAALVAKLGDEEKEVRQEAIKALGQATVPDKFLMAMTALLSDGEKGVRQEAVKALGKQATVPDKVLTAMVALLSDGEKDVRLAALEAVGKSAVLPDKVLTAVAARLDDADKGVRLEALRVMLARVPDVVPDKVLTEMAAWLHNDHGFLLRRTALDALTSRSELLAHALLKKPLVVALYEALLDRSFDEQFSWYIDEGNCYFSMPDGIVELPVDAEHGNVIRQWITGARSADCPPTAGGIPRPSTSGA